MNKKVFSIIIPLYNKQKYIEGTLKSIDAQRLGDFVEIDLVVVDDASTDNSFSIVDDFVFTNSAVKKTLLKTGENIGVARALNYGFTRASGDYVSFFDADDLYLPNAIDVLVTYLNSGHNWVVGNEVKVDEESRLLYSDVSYYSGKVLDKAREPEDIASAYLNLEFFKHLHPAGFKREIFGTELPLNENFRSSYDIFLQVILLKDGISPFFIPDTICAYRLATDSSLLMSSMKSGQKIKDLLQFKELFFYRLNERQQTGLEKLIDYYKKVYAKINEKS